MNGPATSPLAPVPAAPQAGPAAIPAPRSAPPETSAPAVNADLQQLLTTPIESLAPADGGRLGRKARAETHIEQLEVFAARMQRALNATVAELRELGALEASELTVEIGRRRAALEQLDAEVGRRRAAVDADVAAYVQDAEAKKRAAAAELAQTQVDLATAKQAVVETREMALLQEAGVYEYTHPLEDAVAYKSRLERLKDEHKALVKGDRAVSGSKDWTVNGSAAKGQKMIRETSKLMLRAYNAEADNLIRTMKPYKLASAVTRLEKTRQTITRLGSTMDIEITEWYHRLRIQELELTADYLEKSAEEKDRIREQRAQQREEEKAQRELLRQQEKLEKERSHLRSAIEKLTANGDMQAAAELAAKLGEVDAAFEDVQRRQANIGAGYVYVISNRGAFGPNMVKIGMTRRLEPMDRVNELGDASVPFRFDVHAMVFSEDAPGLESRLHDEFADRRVNRVNLRREYFYVSPSQVRAVLEKLAGEHLLEYVEEPEAYEWRASGGSDRVADTVPS
jgi:hypothetical protein